MSQAPDSSGGLSSSSMLGLGALGIGGVGLGAILAKGESPLPSEFGQLTAEVPQLQSESQTLFNTGQTFTGQGAQALEMAQAGVLTPEQKAQLGQYTQGLENTAMQQYANMGRNINQDTSGISTQADIDAKVNAMAQQQIQSTIALGLGETSAGANFSGQALGYTNAANQALIAAGQAQLQQDQNYSNALTGAFTAIGSMFGGLAKTALPLSDARLKTDIVPIGELDNGIGLYSFRYKWDWTPYVGVIAQEVQKTMPAAVLAGDDGWLRVDYAQVGAPFMTLADWKANA